METANRLAVVRYGLMAAFVKKDARVHHVHDNWSDDRLVYPKDQDAVTFFDCFDRVRDLRKSFGWVIDNVLVEGGVVAISMPEMPYLYAATSDAAYMAREFGYWKNNRKDRLTYMTRFGLRRFLESFKLEVVFETNVESFLRIDPTNLKTNMMTVIAHKPRVPKPDNLPPVISGDGVIEWKPPTS